MAFDSTRDCKESPAEETSVTHESFGNTFAADSVEHVFKTPMPHKPKASSATADAIKNMLGRPSTMMLSPRPHASPSMKKISAITAARVKSDRNAPLIQSAIMPKYNPMMARNTCD